MGGPVHHTNIECVQRQRCRHDAAVRRLTIRNLTLRPPHSYVRRCRQRAIRAAPRAIPGECLARRRTSRSAGESGG